MNEHFNDNVSIKKAEAGRSKKERLGDIFNLIEKAPMADSPREAHNVISKSFFQVEHGEHPPMALDSFNDMLSIKNNERTIYYTWFIGHILLLGDNGSIEIRSKQGGFDRDAFAKDLTYIDSFNIIFTKAGADGKSIWKN